MCRYSAAFILCGTRWRYYTEDPASAHWCFVHYRMRYRLIQSICVYTECWVWHKENAFTSIVLLTDKTATVQERPGLLTNVHYEQYDCRQLL